MKRGRPAKGLSHVDSLPGDRTQKERAKAILATLTGALPVEDVCKQLDVSETRFHELRRDALEGMLAGLAPRPPGRPARETETDEVTQLKEEMEWLREELEISRVRTEIALWKPSLLRDPISPPPKKRGSSREIRGRRNRKRGGGSDT
jgi:transposase-like protein